MVDLTSITAALDGLKAAGEIARSLFHLKSESDRQAKIIELQSVILHAQSAAIAAQSERLALQEDMRALKGEVAKLKDWETQKQRYQMAAPFAGTALYALKRSASEGEPPHYICASCYQQSKRSILQNWKDKDHWTSFACPELSCNFKAPTGYHGGVSAEYAEDIKNQ